MIFDPDRHPRAERLYGLAHTWAFPLTSQTGLDYIIYVAWPASPPPPSGWPVVYMLDGETFGIAREIMRYQVGSGVQQLATPRVLVGIGYPGASRRGVDYAPISTDGADHPFRRFLIEKVCPFIQIELPVDASQQTLMGHSIGGLFVLETLFEQYARPDGGMFTRYVASSPSVWWREGHLPRAASAFVEASRTESQVTPVPRAPLSITLSAAQYDQALSPAEQRLPEDERHALAQTRVSRDMVQGNRALADLLASVPGLAVTFRVFDDETHRSVWPRAITSALRD